MKPLRITLFCLLPCLTLSCGKKQPAAATETSAEAPAETPAETAVVLAKRGNLPPVGTLVTTQSSMTMEDAAMIVKAGPQEMEGTATQKGSGNETVEVLAADKLRRLVISKKNEGSMSINGNEQPNPSKSDPLVGEPVLLERKDGTWTASLESGAAPGVEQRKGLDKMVEELERDSDFQMYGDTPRKPGDRWDVDPSKLMNFGDAEEVTGTYTVEFVAKEDFLGTPCAVLKATFDIKGKIGDGKNSPAMDMAYKGEAISRRSLAGLIDLGVEVDGIMTVSGSPAPNVEIEIEGPAQIVQKITLGKK
jgi:hypothetical protein